MRAIAVTTALALLGAAREARAEAEGETAIDLAWDAPPAPRGGAGGSSSARDAERRAHDGVDERRIGGGGCPADPTDPDDA